jgi:hypothetical protein
MVNGFRQRSRRRWKPMSIVATSGGLLETASNRSARPVSYYYKTEFRDERHSGFDATSSFLGDYHVAARAQHESRQPSRRRW